MAILKHTYDLSDEALCDRWLENPYYQLFCRWRQRMGEEKLGALIQASKSLSVATKSEAAKPLE